MSVCVALNFQGEDARRQNLLGSRWLTHAENIKRALADL